MIRQNTFAEARGQSGKKTNNCFLFFEQKVLKCVRKPYIIHINKNKQCYVFII